MGGGWGCEDQGGGGGGNNFVGLLQLQMSKIIPNRSFVTRRGRPVGRATVPDRNFEEILILAAKDQFEYNVNHTGQFYVYPV